MEAAAHAHANWYKLDNAAKIFSSLSGPRLTTLFRLSATLREPVHAGRLQEALQRLMPRVPYFAVQLRPGAFWYYFDPNPGCPQVVADSRYPCLAFAYRRHGSFPFRVRAYHRRIAIEIAHALTDGTGGLIFLKSLLAEYFRLGGLTCPDPGELLLPEQPPHPEEAEDAFRRYYRPDVPPARRPEPAFQLPFALEPPGVYHLTTGLLPVSAVLAVAKSHQVTLTELLIAVHLDSFQQVFQRLPVRLRRRLARPIRLDIPVNLRSHFPSRTMRNFFLPVYPTIDPRLGNYTFAEILKQVHHFMQAGIDQKYLSQQIARNVATERHPLTRITPLIVKDRILATAYERIAQRGNTSGLSNLGRITLPAPLGDHVERFDFIAPPPTTRRVNCGVLSYGDRLIVNIGRTCRESWVEEAFFRHFTAWDVPVTIESND
jgi:hypothetical protein